MNLELLQFAMYLGLLYDARVSSWGRDEESNKQLGGHPKSWHLWTRGANAIDLIPSASSSKSFNRRLKLMANEAREKGYQAVPNYKRGYVHIEVPW